MLATSRFHLRIWPVWLSVGTILLLWLICKWAYHDWFDDGFKYVAKAASLSATTLMCWCVVLSARFRVVEDLFGGLDKVYQIHKRLGKTLCVVIALHPLFLAAHRLPDLPAFLSYFAPELNVADSYSVGKDIGIAVLIALYALVGISLRLIMRYDVWKRLHEYLGPVLILAAALPLRTDPHDGSDQHATARQGRTPARHLRRGLQPRVRAGGCACCWRLYRNGGF